jgi:hypothetical protein
LRGRARRGEGQSSIAIFKIEGPPGVVQRRLHKIRGLRKAYVNAIEETAWVLYDPSVVSESDIKQVCKTSL